MLQSVAPARRIPYFSVKSFNNVSGTSDIRDHIDFVTLYYNILHYLYTGTVNLYIAT